MGKYFVDGFIVLGTNILLKSIYVKGDSVVLMFVYLVGISKVSIA